MRSSLPVNDLRILVWCHTALCSFNDLTNEGVFLVYFLIATPPRANSVNIFHVVVVVFDGDPVLFAQSVEGLQGVCALSTCTLHSVLINGALSNIVDCIQAAHCFVWGEIG